MEYTVILKITMDADMPSTVEAQTLSMMRRLGLQAEVVKVTPVEEKDDAARYANPLARPLF